MTEKKKKRRYEILLWRPDHQALARYGKGSKTIYRYAYSEEQAAYLAMRDNPSCTIEGIK